MMSIPVFVLRFVIMSMGIVDTIFKFIMGVILEIKRLGTDFFFIGEILTCPATIATIRASKRMNCEQKHYFN